MKTLNKKVTIKQIYKSLVKDKCLLCSNSMDKEKQLETELKIIVPLCIDHRLDCVAEQIKEKK